MARKLVKTVQDRIDAAMASLAVWFMDAWTVVERSWRRPLSRLALRLKPCPRIALQLRADNRQNLRVIGGPPFSLGAGKQREIDQRTIDRHESQRFEAEKHTFRAIDFARLDKLQVFDADAVIARLVIARLVGEDHPGQ